MNMSARTDEDNSFDDWWQATHSDDSTVRPHDPRTVRDVSARTDEDNSFDDWWQATHSDDSTARPHDPRTVRDGKKSVSCERNCFIFQVCVPFPTQGVAF